MTKMIDREQVRKALMEAMDEVVEHVCGVAEKGDVARLDEQLRRATLGAAESGLAALCSQLADQSAAPDCPNCGRRMRFKQWRPFVLRSGLTGGSLTLQSPYFVCDHCHVGALPLRQRLGLDHDGFTPLLRELAIRAGTLEPFEEASTEVLERIAGVHVSGSKIHELCKAAGEAAAALANEGTLGKARPLKPGEKLYVEVDGGMLRIDAQWREAKVGIAFPARDIAEVSKERRELTHRRVCATLEGREKLGELILQMIAPYLPQTPDGAPIIAGNVEVLGDGSEWIRHLVDEHLPGARQRLDWYHVTEHLAEAALALYPDDEQKRRKWCTKQKNLLHDGRESVLLQRLARLSMGLEAGSPAQEAVAGLHRYLNERRGLLGYCAARQRGLLIGSGAIESAIGHVLQQRMKRSGMRWKRPGAAPMVALRCAYRSTGGMDALFARMMPAA